MKCEDGSPGAVLYRPPQPVRRAQPSGELRGSTAADRGRKVRLGASERMFLALHRFTATNVVRVMALEGTLAPARIEAVLPLLSARHPLLGMRVHEHAGVAEFRHEPALRLVLEVIPRTNDQHWLLELERLLNTPISHEGGPLLRLCHLYRPDQQRSELFVVGDHAICDGISINALCGELLALAAGGSTAPPRPLLPALVALLPRFSALRIASALGRQLAQLAFISLSGRRDQAGPGQTTRFLSAALDRGQTATLVSRARSEQTTITAVLMAAILLSLSETKGARLSLSLPINLRQQLGRELAADDLAHLTSMVYLTAKTDDGLFPLARALKQKLTHMLSHERLLAALEPTYELGRRLLRRRSRALAHALLSSSGVVPLRREYDGFRVLDLYSGTSARMLSADFGFFCNTFDGRLRINLVFLEEAVEPERAERVLARVVARLAQPA